MEVVARRPAKVLFALAQFAFVFAVNVLLALVASYALVGCALVAALDGHVRADLVRPIAHAITAPVVVSGWGWYTWFCVSRLAQSRLRLEGDEVVFRGTVAWRGVVERRYRLDELESVTLGQPLNAVERVLDRTIGAETAVFLKEGHLCVRDRSGRRVVFQFVNVVFERAALLTFVGELWSRGVVVGEPA